VKWEPLLAMVALLLLGLWLVWGPGATHRYTLRDGARVDPIRLANARGVIETAPDPASGEPTFRILLRDGFASPPLPARQFRETFGDAVYQAAIADRTNFFFRLFNITSWWSLAWIAVGLTGQLAFTGRTLIQWFISERKRESVVPVIFWWLSLGGGVMLFAYFAWRQDVVGVLGQSAGVVIYARNLRLIAKRQRRAARDAVRLESTPAATPAPSAPRRLE
jgi:lipid-A-disaccharide synthase-like uncharacterized protein